MNKGIKTAICLLIAAAFMAPTAASIIGNGAENEPGVPENTPYEAKVCDPLGYDVNVPRGNILEEDFEGTWLPTGWNEYIRATANDAWEQHDTYSHSGMYSAGHLDYDADCDDWLVTPLIDLATWMDAELNFWETTYYSSYYGYSGVWVSDDSGDPADGDFVELAEITPGPTDETWYEHTLSLSAYDGEEIYIAFVYQGYYVHQWYVDDVNVGAPVANDVGVAAINSPTTYTQIEPKKVNVTVENFGLSGQTSIPVIYEICEEITNTIFFDDMESGSGNWIAIDVDGDGDTWALSTARSYSPTHSYKCTAQGTYEPNAFDSLKMKNTVDLTGATAVGATLGFWYWCEGEYVEETLDYGMVYVDDTEIGGPYYDTEGEWVWEGIDLSAFIGQNIKVNFTWYSDFNNQYEGWYVDDVAVNKTTCEFKVDGYATIPSLGVGENTTIEFPNPWTPPEEAWYRVTAWTDLSGDQNPGNDEWMERMWFGDVCDAAITDLSGVPSEIEKDPTDIASVPIEFTVENTGTLTKDIPVKVSVQEKMYETLYKDDMEGEFLVDDGGNWVIVDFGAGGAAEWMFTDMDFYSPYNSLYFGDSSHQYDAGHIACAVYDCDIDWEDVKDKPTFDIKAKMKWNFGNDDYISALLRIGSMWTRFVTADFTGDGAYGPHPPSSDGWTEISFCDVMAPYMASRIGPDANFNNLYEITKYYADDEGVPIENCDWGFCVMGSDWYDTLGAELGMAWSGVHIDDFEIYTEYAGATIWTNTTNFSLDPGESESQDLTWAAEDYCDYMITAASTLDCDMIPENDEKSTTTRIYNQIYEDGYDEATTEDNTYGLSDDWHIIGDENHYWWDGIDEDDAYAADADDVLVIDKVFNFTENTWYNLSFDTVCYVENAPNAVPWDYAILEISNDSGLNWYPIDIYQAITAWLNMPYNLYNPSGTGLLDTSHVVYNWYEMTSLTCPAVGRTNETHIRFHMLSDSATNLKGWFIDDVEITNATDTLFFDDMESGDGKWIHMKEPTGDLWHQAGDEWHCSDTYYSWYNAYLEVCIYGNYWNDLFYEEAQPGYYRDNMDDKLILTFNLSNAYEAFLEWDQNYSFAGMYPDDYGLVEILTGSGWKTLFIVQGDTGGAWGHMRLDITDYVGGGELANIRFKFISNDTVTGEGWKLRNFCVDGKVDVGMPTTTCTFNPVTPDGNNGYYVSPVTITLTATDDKGIAATYYRIDGGAWVEYAAPITINIDGTHSVDYYSLDVDGNKEPTHSTGTFKIDLTAPTVGTAVPKEGYLYLFGNELRETIGGRTIIIGGLTAEATASDATSGLYVVQFKCDGTVFGEDTTSPYKSIMPSAFLFGSHTLTVTAQDFAGNTATSAAIDYLKIL